MTEEKSIGKRLKERKTSNLKLYMLVTLFVVMIVTAVIIGTYWFRREVLPTEEQNHEIELIVFSIEGCSACTKAIKTVEEIAESSEIIEYRIVKYGEESEEFEKFGVDFTMVPVTIVLIDGEVRGILGSAYNLDTKIIDIIKRYTSLTITPLPQTVIPAPTTPTTTSSPTTTPAPTEIIKYTNLDAGISFEYPSYLTHGTSSDEYTLVVLQNKDVWMDIIRIEASHYTVEEFNDYVIDSLCRDYPPCEVMQRVKTHLGEEIGERIIVQYTQNGVKKVRFSLLADHKGYRYDVRFFTTLSKFNEYMEDAKKIMESFEFLSTAPEISTPEVSLKYIDEEAGISFEYPTSFFLSAEEETNKERGIIAILYSYETKDEKFVATIKIRRMGCGSGYTIERYTNEVIEYFSKEYPSSKLIERTEMSLGGAKGERILIEYVQNGVKWVRFSLSANYKGCRYDVLLFTTLSKFDEYREYAEKVMESFKFLP